MPVTMNEPLSALQRLCEELQYAELLNEANELEDPYDRMVRVAAFAVSAYSGTQYRAGNKPFNPLLGETYECVREDKGFKFVAEQVCTVYLHTYVVELGGSVEPADWQCCQLCTWIWWCCQLRHL